MAKKQEKEIDKVELKSSPLDLPRLGMYITDENLTIDRYKKLVSISPEFEQFFKVTYKPKKDESKMETA